MNFELASRVTEVLLGWAFLQQSMEHLAGPRAERVIFGLRAVLSVLLMLSVQSGFVLLGLVVLNIWILHHFQGPYNGGSDRMGGLILFCLTLAYWLPYVIWREAAFGYLGVQLVLSYVISGMVKLRNPEWRTGRALSDVFAFSAYPVSEGLRALSERAGLMFAGSWAVIMFEVFFPLSLVSQDGLFIALTIGAAFHLANACLFGLNRFFWVWLAAYPSLIWLQDRLIL